MAFFIKSENSKINHGTPTLSRYERRMAPQDSPAVCCYVY